MLTLSGSLGLVDRLEIVAAHIFPLQQLRRNFEDCGDRPLESWKYCAIDGSKSKILTDDAEWQKLDQLIRKLPALDELIWACW